jgi:hypothetical protein
MKVTTDFYLACWLFLHKNVELVEHSRERNRSIFSFQGDNLEKLVNEYNNGSATCKVADYAEATRSLKAIMYSTQPYDKKWNSIGR